MIATCAHVYVIAEATRELLIDLYGGDATVSRVPQELDQRRRQI